MDTLTTAVVVWRRSIPTWLRGEKPRPGEDPDWFAGNYEYQVPIFVLTHQPPKKHPKETSGLTFTFVMDGLESAIKQVKEAAGDKGVNVIGATSTAQQCLPTGLAYELHVDVTPMLLGSGLRALEDTGLDQIQLERIKVVELPGGRTDLRFRIIQYQRGVRMKATASKSKNSSSGPQENEFPKIGQPALRALAGAGIHSLEQLTSFSEDELKQLHGMGPKALGILRQALTDKGLSFASEKRK